MKALKRLNEALPGLVAGILLYGAAIELAGVWLAEDKLRYSVGLWIGIGCAVFMAVHIALVLEESARIGGDQSRRLSAKSVLRYLIVVAVFLVMMKFELGNLLPAFIGVMGLKVSAYAQPLMHKMKIKQKKEEEEVKM